MSSFPAFTGFFKDARWSLETLEVMVAEKRKVFLSRGTTCVAFLHQDPLTHDACRKWKLQTPTFVGSSG